jgi:hypothetical protein
MFVCKPNQYQRSSDDDHLLLAQYSEDLDFYDFLLNDHGPLVNKWGEPVSEEDLRRMTPQQVRERGMARRDE